MTDSLFGTEVPSSVNNADGVDYSLGTRFTAAVDGTITHGKWYFPTTIPSVTVPVQVAVWSAIGGVLASATFPLGATLGAWNTVALSSPVAVTAGLTYEVSIWTPLRYVATPTYSWPHTSGNLTAASPNGYYAVSPGSVSFASTVSPNTASYFADILFEPTGATPAPNGISVPITLGAPTVGTTISPVFPNGLSVPITLGSPRVGATVASVTDGGSWWKLASIDAENAQNYRDSLLPPVECPNDGEVLQRNPRTGKLQCRYDGYVYP